MHIIPARLEAEVKRIAGTQAGPGAKSKRHYLKK
jgi:hypothetical protein